MVVDSCKQLFVVNIFLFVCPEQPKAPIEQLQQKHQVIKKLKTRPTYTYCKSYYYNLLVNNWLKTVITKLTVNSRND